MKDELDTDELDTDEAASAQDEANPQFAVVYRGFDPQWTAMLADSLRAEGINCHHLGTQNPALADIGGFVCEQRLEVPVEEMERARPLIEASVAPPSAIDIEAT